MSKDDKLICKIIKEHLTHIEVWTDKAGGSFLYQPIIASVYGIRFILKELSDVCVRYRTRIGKLKRQVQQLNKENKLLREQYNILFNDGRNMYQELKEIKNGNKTN